MKHYPKPCPPDPCSNKCGPDMPAFCPPVAPPPPCSPPVPSVVEGESLYQAVNNLSNRVNVCINTYNDVMANCYKTLHNLEAAAQENGAYYGPCEVWTEEGYDANESATYTLIHKACVDRRGEPIRMELHLAYGNTTNSKIEQSLWSASKITYADKIVVAQPMGANGWYGNAIWHGAPINSASEPSLYTVGFTRAGVMRVYSNAVSVDQMLRDTVENAMGCSGVLIQNGQITDDSWRANIPNATEQVSRIVMGQNLDTREVIFLVCGNENDVNRKGMTSKACAEILLQYGCDIAVELAEGASAGAMDKGSLIFTPDNDNVPNAYAFWYISRKCFYRTDYERELAELMQNYGRAIWETYLNYNRIQDLRSDLNEEIQNRIDGDNALNTALEQEIQDRKDGDAALNAALQQEITDRTNADVAINARIDQEIEDRKAGDAALNTALSQEVSDRKAADAALKAELQEEINSLETRVTACETNIKTLQDLYNTLQEQMAKLDEAVTSIQLTISSIETALNNVKISIENLRSEIIGIKDGSIVLPYLPIKGGTMQGAINMGGFSISNLPSPSANADAATKKYVDDAISGGITPPTGDYLPLSGGQMSGNIDMASNRITTLGAPTAGTDAVNKDYVDNAVETGKYTLPAATAESLGGVKIGQNVNVTGDGTISVTFPEVSGFLPTTGGTMSGNISMTGSSKVTQSTAPSDNADLTNKQYVDQQIAAGAYTLPAATSSTLGGVKIGENVNVTPDGTISVTIPSVTGFLPTTGGTMSGNISMSGSSKVTQATAPTENADLTNKQYVDQKDSALESKINNVYTLWNAHLLTSEPKSTYYNTAQGDYADTQNWNPVDTSGSDYHVATISDMGLCLAVSIAGPITKINTGTNNRLIINVPDMPASSIVRYGRPQTCIATAHERTSQTAGTSCIASLSNMQYVDASNSVDFIFTINEMAWSGSMDNPSTAYPVGKNLQFNALILIPKISNSISI
nr:MAG TPA: tail fiber-like protein [Caudoviricetes sp.]